MKTGALADVHVGQLNVPAQYAGHSPLYASVQRRSIEERLLSLPPMRSYH
jgi:hypothetical protein